MPRKTDNLNKSIFNLVFTLDNFNFYLISGVIGLSIGLFLVILAFFSDPINFREVFLGIIIIVVSLFDIKYFSNKNNN
ncbi:MAG: hypothetical protein WCJ58_07110 [bacterium]